VSSIVLKAYIPSREFRKTSFITLLRFLPISVYKISHSIHLLNLHTLVNTRLRFHDARVKFNIIYIYFD